MNTMRTITEDDFKDILNGLIDGVITINQHCTILTFNKTAESIFGYDSQEVIGKNVSLLMPEPQRSARPIRAYKHYTQY